MSESDAYPYVGLRPFKSTESIKFFGRNKQTNELLERLHEHRFLAVVGSSGCGKSSLLLAGLIPALKGGYLLKDSNEWMIAIMKPGQSPMFNLVQAILIGLGRKAESKQVNALLKAISEKGINAIITLITPFRIENNFNFFLLVDQFEELFRFCKEQKDVNKQNEAIRFVNTILELSAQSLIPFHVVLTMRSDFIGDCSQFYGLPEAMNKSQYLVPRLDRQQLKKVITGPAKLYGVEVNSFLTSKLLNRLGQVQDELPVLQHALMRMWDYEQNTDKSGELDLKDFDNIGGFEKALSKDANKALREIVKADRPIAEQLFKALTDIDENGRKIRRRLKLSHLKALTGASEDKLLNIIDHFVRKRRSFLYVREVADTGDILIDISHESLIRQWDRLGKWVDEEGKDASFYKRLSEAQRLYNAKERERDLLTDIEFEKVEQWFNKFKPTKIWTSQYDENYKACRKYFEESGIEYYKKKRKELYIRRGIRILKYISIIVLSGVALYFLINRYLISKEPGPIDWEKLISENNENNAWSLVLKNNTALDYEQFLVYFPNGEYKEIARDSFEFRKYDDNWNLSRGQETQAGYEDYLNNAIDFTYNSALKGEDLFKENCAACHRLNENLVGPALVNVEQRLLDEEGLDRGWLTAWIKNSQGMIKSGDEYAVKIYNEYNQTMQTAFPNLTEENIKDILDYTNTESVKKVYSKYARHTEEAERKLDSIIEKNSGQRVIIDQERWQNALKDNNVGAYISYYMDDAFFGQYKDDAIMGLKEVGKSGLILAGWNIDNSISDPVYSLIKTNRRTFNSNDMLTGGDIIQSNQPLIIYSLDGFVSDVVKPGQYCYVDLVEVQEGMVVAQIVYEGLHVRSDNVDGENVVLIEYEGNKVAKGGQFNKVGPSLWIELSFENDNVFYWEEVSISNKGVHIEDPSRGYNILLDLQENNVILNYDSQNEFVLYKITEKSRTK